jgi:hypothetical protein
LYFAQQGSTLAYQAGGSKTAVISGRTNSSSMGYLVVFLLGLESPQIRAAKEAAGGLVVHYEFDLHHSGDTASSFPVFNRLKQIVGFDCH